MQRALLNRATMRVADTTEVSGRVTAESIEHGSRPKKQTSLWRLTIFGCAVSIGVFTSLAPTPGQAQGAHRGRCPHLSKLLLCKQR
jgi:hypothetical protein